MAYLSLLGEDGSKVQGWEVGDEPVAVGRDGTADVAVADDTLSRRHFVIWREGQDYLIKDLDSQNGTWVDGRRAQGTKLRPNDCILAGRTLFLFSERPQSPAGQGLPPTRDTAFLPAVLAVERVAQRSAQKPGSA